MDPRRSSSSSADASSVLALIVDCSGSMAELGKWMLARNLVAAVREQPRLSPETWPLGGIRCFLLGVELVEQGLEPEDELPQREPTGAATLASMQDGLSKLVEECDHLRVLVLSDGRFGRDEVLAFRRWRGAHTGFSVRCISVGADADVLALRSLADPGGVFLAEDIHAALDGWPPGGAAPPLPDGMDGLDPWLLNGGLG